MTDPPYSQESEEAVIGAVLTNPNAYLNVSSFLKPDDFFFLRHTYIWEAMREIVGRGDKIDTVTVSERLSAIGLLAEIGGPAYLTQLISNVPTSVHAEVYGHLVERTAYRRRLIKAADEIKILARDENETVESISQQAESKLLDVTGLGVEQVETDIDVLAHIYLTSVENLIELKEQGIMPGLPTGFRPVDDIIGGLYKGELTVIAGPPKSGKTTFNLNVARNRLKAGARVAIFSCEMDAQSLIRKFISAETGIPAKVIKDVAFTPEQYSQLVEATNKISQWPLHIIDAYNTLTPLDIRRELRKITQNYLPDAVLIDGLWLMESNSTKRSVSERRDLEVTDIMKELLKIIKEFNVGIDLVHQCNSAANTRRDKRFQLFDLGESIGVARNATTIIGLYRAGYYNPDDTDDIEVIIKATREGNTGTAVLQFDKDHEMYTYNEASVKAALAYKAAAPPQSNDDRKDIYQ